ILLLLSISSIALVTIPSISFLVLLIKDPYFLFSSTLISFSPDKISIIRLFLPTYFDLTFNMSASLLQALSSSLKLATKFLNSSSINSILPKKQVHKLIKDELTRGTTLVYELVHTL